MPRSSASIRVGSARAMEQAHAQRECLQSQSHLGPGIGLGYTYWHHAVPLRGLAEGAFAVEHDLRRANDGGKIVSIKQTHKHANQIESGSEHLPKA